MNLCPYCGKATSSGKSESFLICKVCGMVYAEFGTNRRREGRLKVSKECVLTFKIKEDPLVATVEDISLNGARVVYPGASLMKGGMGYIDVDHLDLHAPAKVVWTVVVDDGKQSAGLRLIWPSETVGAFIT